MSVVEDASSQSKVLKGLDGIQRIVGVSLLVAQLNLHIVFRLLKTGASIIFGSTVRLSALQAAGLLLLGDVFGKSATQPPMAIPGKL